MLDNYIICKKHKGLRFIDQSMGDIRTVCDKCGQEDNMIFPALTNSVSMHRCKIHNTGLQADMLGIFCVYCILEKSMMIR